MPKYNVQMTRLAVVWREEEIEADNRAEAEKEALAQFEDDENGWELNGIYNDGKPYCELSVNEISELDEEGFPIDDKIDLTTEEEVRAAFWDLHPHLRKEPKLNGAELTQNEYPADTRMTFCDFIENLVRDKRITESLAKKVTL